jgi:hypothetical protein
MGEQSDGAREEGEKEEGNRITEPCRRYFALSTTFSSPYKRASLKKTDRWYTSHLEFYPRTVRKIKSEEKKQGSFFKLMTIIIIIIIIIMSFIYVQIK